MPASLTAVLAGLGIDTPTPIQAATLPDSLAGRDVLGRGRTGSGKTYAFLLPLVARLSKNRSPRRQAPRALVLAPTRELVGQIEASLAPLAQASGLTYRTIFGGVSQRAQVAALSRGVDIVIACPGRLEDLIGQKHCTLADVEITVLDEADHMADLGFLPAVRRLLSQTPQSGQRLLFSATLDQAIDTLVRQFLTRPITHQADSMQSPVREMSHHVLHIEREHRLSILLDLTSAPGRTMVFTRTKRGAQGLARQLNRGGVPAVELHGNLSQNARTRNLDAFHAGNATVLVATDIAARGIHVDNVRLVVHADPPIEHKAYLHRSGRTARAGNAGTVVTLMTGEQASGVRDLARAAGISPITTRIKDNAHPILVELAPGDRALRGPFQASAEPGPHSAQQSPKARQQRRRPGRGASQASTTNPRARASSTSQHSAANEKVAARSGGSRRSTARTPGARHSAAAFSSGRR
ncbi:MAG TPA: DEAD/DEAH box helicase [Jatrophihabitans sp.]|nr:DEAD/DEAH box helicase [Jatrophihabitans sp.]